MQRCARDGTRIGARSKRDLGESEESERIGSYLTVFREVAQVQASARVFGRHVWSGEEYCEFEMWRWRVAVGEEKRWVEEWLGLGGY
jgi:hypothetical protein